MTLLPDGSDRVYLRTSPLEWQARVNELRRRQAQLRERIEHYLAATGQPLRPGIFEDHTELLTALQSGPAHLAAERAAIAVDIAALVHGLHTTMRDITPLDPQHLPRQLGQVYVLQQADPRVLQVLEDVRTLLVRWANRWSRFQSAASGPPA